MRVHLGSMVGTAWVLLAKERMQLVAPSVSSMRRAAAPRVLAGAEIAGDVVQRVTLRVTARAAGPRGPKLEEVVSETIYREEQRLAHAAPDPRTLTDRAHVARLRSDLAHYDEARRPEIVHGIVEHYAAQISGHFDRRVYAATTRILPGTLGAFLHGLVPGSAEDLHHFFDVDDRVIIDGEVGALRALAELGTIVLAPTHVSNLDSILMGYAIHRLDLPPFAYGAGLNLFSSALLGFFMQNLGAYTVDRKNTDPLYRETLKEYTTVLLERGQHSLFFPGGTRSRSGAVETRLKMGLLGTSPIAFRHALEAERPRPRVFVVPCTLTYPLVLEAASLVGDYLRAEGGPQYIDLRDEFDRPRRLVDFLRGLLRLDLRIHLRIGTPLDPMGNEVDHEGTSHDPRGRAVDPARYLTRDGKLAADDERDAEYTRFLSARLVAAYRRDTVALPTSVLASVLLARLRRAAEQPDLFRFLRSLDPSKTVPESDVRADLAIVLRALPDLETSGRVRVARELRDAGPESVLTDALRTFGSYHTSPVVERRGDALVIGDPSLLFYYANRLQGALP